MRRTWVTPVATAVLAEVLGHFLALGWGFMTLVAAFVVIAVRLSTLTATVNSKAYSVEQRLATHVIAAAPAINLQANGGTIGGATTVSGNTTVTGFVSSGGQLFVNGASGSATMEVNGNGHVTSGLQVDGNHVVGGTVSAGGQVLAGGASSSATFAVNGNGHITSGLQVDGNLVTSTGGSIPQAVPSNAGTFVLGTLNPGTSNLSAWAASVTNVVNNTLTQLTLAGVLH